VRWARPGGHRSNSRGVSPPNRARSPEEKKLIPMSTTLTHQRCSGALRALERELGLTEFHCDAHGFLAVTTPKATRLLSVREDRSLRP
jgi:hypothetical protein